MMLCITKKIKTESGAEASIWVPTFLDIREDTDALLGLTGVTGPGKDISVDVYQESIDIGAVHRFDKLRDMVYDDMMSSPDSFIKGARPLRRRTEGVPGDCFEKPVILPTTITAKLWKLVSTRYDFTRGIARTVFEGYRDYQAFNSGMAPLTKKSAHVVITKGILTGPWFKQTNRQLLQYVTQNRKSKLFGGRVNPIDV